MALLPIGVYKKRADAGISVRVALTGSANRAHDAVAGAIDIDRTGQSFGFVSAKFRTGSAIFLKVCLVIPIFRTTEHVRSFPNAPAISASRPNRTAPTSSTRA